MIYQLEEQKLIEAVDAFARKMKSRLLHKMRQGYTGWNDRSKTSDLDIAMKMHDDIDYDHPDKNAVDIANRAMILWFRVNNGALSRKPRPQEEQCHTR